MKKTYSFTIVLVLLFSVLASAQKFEYSDHLAQPGLTLLESNGSTIVLNYSISEFYLEDATVNGEAMKTLKLPGTFLPNDEGAPDLPGNGRYIAIPEGSTATVNITALRSEVIKGVNIAPAPRIPLETDNGQLFYKKNEKIYSKNAFYPESFIQTEISQIRGIDVVMLGITPFQYNPVTKDLVIYRDFTIELNMSGGTGHVGEDRLRSRWWDPIIMDAVLNPEAIPAIDYNNKAGSSKTPDYEYLIICPDNPTFISWADSIKLFRNRQGIKTGVVTTTALGGNTVSAIEAYVDNAYNTWDEPPSAVLLLGDYGTGTSGIISQFYTHPAGYPDFVSDNRFADVTGDNLPEIAFARITANDASQLQVMISKFLKYERNPPTDYNFYDHPITALGWQTERWFQLCSEVVGGYFRNELGKNPVRINAIYSGTPGTVWSTATNTSTVVNYFGPSGLGYIPATPAELGGWSGGTATQVVNAINSGSFMLQHRDHGFYDGWGEPAFTSTNISSLTNINNKLPYVFSINCQTGAFHRTAECFTEKFHRYTYGGQNSGALGVMAATEVSYSFVNDTYLWGVMDNLFPDFMPAQSTTFPVNYVMPAFGNVAGKIFLYQSNWPYNTSDKLITYRLFHHHGDAFMTVYTQVPQNLTVSHNSTLSAGATNFSVSANAGSLIALTVNGEILGTATGTGSPVTITIPAQNLGNVMVVTVTKQNYFRYSSNVNVITTGLYAEFTVNNPTPYVGGTVTFSDLSYGSPTSWAWSFSPATITYVGGTNSNSQNPQLQFNAAGYYSVTLTVSNAGGSDSETKSNYILASIAPPVANFSASTTTPVLGQTVTFTDLSTNSPTSWAWSFSPSTVTYVGGTTSSSQHPQLQFIASGNYTVTLVATNAGGSDCETKTNYITVSQYGGSTATLSLPVVSASSTGEIAVPLHLDEISSNLVVGIQISFHYDPAYITWMGTSATPGNGISYINPALTPLGGDWLWNSLTGNLVFTWIDPNLTGVSISPGDLVILRFNYLGGLSYGQSTPITFSLALDYEKVKEGKIVNELTDENFVPYMLTLVNGEVINDDIRLDLTVFLQGPFNGTSMTPFLNGILPYTQPYNTNPWNYTGTEYVVSMPNANVVDWVLVELRDTTSVASATSATMMDRKAAFLLNNGKVVGLDGISNLQFNNSLNQQLFVVIWHRNHLGVMTSTSVAESGGVYTYNFSTGAGQAYGGTSAHKQIGPGVWGMIGGDGDKDGNISTSDKSPIWEIQAGTQGYLESDYNLDTQSDNKDKDDIWAPNIGAGSQVPN